MHHLNLAEFRLILENSNTAKFSYSIKNKTPIKFIQKISNFISFSVDVSNVFSFLKNLMNDSVDS